MALTQDTVTRNFLLSGCSQELTQDLFLLSTFQDVDFGGS